MTAVVGYTDVCMYYVEQDNPPKYESIWTILRSIYNGTWVSFFAACTVLSYSDQILRGNTSRGLGSTTPPISWLSWRGLAPPNLGIP